MIVDEPGPTVSKGRSQWDAPEIDGNVYVAAAGRSGRATSSPSRSSERTPTTCTEPSSDRSRFGVAPELAGDGKHEGRQGAYAGQRGLRVEQAALDEMRICQGLLQAGDDGAAAIERLEQLLPVQCRMSADDGFQCRARRVRGLPIVPEFAGDSNCLAEVAPELLLQRADGEKPGIRCRVQRIASTSARQQVFGCAWKPAGGMAFDQPLAS